MVLSLIREWRAKRSVDRALHNVLEEVCPSEEEIEEGKEIRDKTATILQYLGEREPLEHKRRKWWGRQKRFAHLREGEEALERFESDFIEEYHFHYTEGDLSVEGYRLLRWGPFGANVWTWEDISISHDGEEVYSGGAYRGAHDTEWQDALDTVYEGALEVREEKRRERQEKKTDLPSSLLRRAP